MPQRQRTTNRPILKLTDSPGKITTHSINGPSPTSGRTITNVIVNTNYAMFKKRI